MKYDGDDRDGVSGKVGVFAEKSGSLSVVFFLKVVSVGGFASPPESGETPDFTG